MSNAIVQVNVSVTLAPTPSTVQQSGAFISQGGTTLATNTLGGPYTQLSQITSILAGAKTLSALSWAGGTVTATTGSPHGWNVGDTVAVVISGTTPAGYSGYYVNAQITGESTFTYPLTNNPGVATATGTVNLASENEISQMANTFFANNGTVGVYILELGEGTVAAGVTALSAWLAANNSGDSTPQILYGVLVPREWDGNSSFIAMCGNFTSPTQKFYFWVTTTYTNRALYGGLKCVFAEVESPNVAATEFSLAAAFSTTLSWYPSSTYRIPPLFYTNSYGATPYPAAGNGTVFTNLKTANVNWIGTGVEGGLSNSIQFYGTLSDGNVFNFWYSGDWAQFQLKLAMANEIINGSNNTINPLLYDQQGINRLQNRGLEVFRQGVAAGLGNGTVLGTNLPTPTFLQNFNSDVYVGQLVLNAEPFVINAAENPTDYGIGTYRGFTGIWTPAQGFKQVIFNLNLTDIIAPA